MSSISGWAVLIPFMMAYMAYLFPQIPSPPDVDQYLSRYPTALVILLSVAETPR